MTLELTCKIEGIDKAFEKLDHIGQSDKLVKAVNETALELSRKLAEVNPKGNYGHYLKSGEFVHKRYGGLSRRGWSNIMRIGTLTWRILNPINYVGNIKYAKKRTSDVVDHTYLYPGRQLTSIIDVVIDKFRTKLGEKVHQALTEALK
jgi:hypothetical protein